MITATRIIGQHLDKGALEIIPQPGVCRMCGLPFQKGIAFKFGPAFTDFNYFKAPQEKMLCPDCMACLGKIESPNSGKMVFFRNFSFLATEDKLEILPREKIMRHILNPPDTPFVLCVTYSNKKHMSFKASVNIDPTQYIVTTDIGDVNVNRNDAQHIVETIQPWYAILPDKIDTKAQPTYFTKNDVLIGCTHNKRIQDYGISKYFTETAIIEKWRRTALLKLLVFCLNKAMPDIEHEEVNKPKQQEDKLKNLKQLELF